MLCKPSPFDSLLSFCRRHGLPALIATVLFLAATAHPVLGQIPTPALTPEYGSAFDAAAKAMTGGPGTGQKADMKTAQGASRTGGPITNRAARPEGMPAMPNMPAIADMSSLGNPVSGLGNGAPGWGGTWMGSTPSASTPYQLPDITKRENLSPALQLVVLLTVLSIVPSILLMMTCFTRFIIVLSLLRQALGTQQLPPNQVLVGLALFMTLVVMGPTIARVNNEALQPYLNGEPGFTQEVALRKALAPIRGFMARQIDAAQNEADVDLFTDFAKQPRARSYDDVPTMTLIPAFMLSELKTAFLIGFKIYLPFLVIDMVISSVLISMGMMMLPPAMISLPFKLLLFVLVDGWRLTAAALMGSFA